MASLGLRVDKPVRQAQIEASSVQTLENCSFLNCELPHSLSLYLSLCLSLTLLSCQLLYP